MVVATLSGCAEDTSSEDSSAIAIADPLLARALNDPIMADPDLAYRNEANAVITIRHDHALPAFGESGEAAQRARDAARLQLLDGGQIRDIPQPIGDAGSANLADLRMAGEIVKAVGGPGGCAEGLTEGLAWAARLPEVARIMPHGMVQQAAGKDADGCSVRVIRYLTPVDIEDALEFHFNHAVRARLSGSRFAEPEAILQAERGDVHLNVHARPGPSGFSAVDVVYWQG